MVKHIRESKRIFWEDWLVIDRTVSGAADTLKNAPAMKKMRAMPTIQKRKGRRAGYIVLL
jgi:hypothetical protein